jgi:hypothetical protein
MGAENVALARQLCHENASSASLEQEIISACLPSVCARNHMSRPTWHRGSPDLPADSDGSHKQPHRDLSAQSAAIAALMSVTGSG